MRNIVLTKCVHQSGRHTLKESVDGKLAYDLRGPLFGNMDPVAFEKAVKARAEELEALGDHVTVKG